MDYFIPRTLLVLFFTCISQAQSSFDFQLNGQKIEANRYRVKVDDQIKVTCAADRKNAYVKAIIPAITDNEFWDASSGTSWQENLATYSRKVKPSDGNDGDCLKVICQSSQDRTLIDDSRIVCLKIEGKSDRFPKPSNIAMKILVNGTGVNTDSYELKPDDKIRVSCSIPNKETNIRFYSKGRSFLGTGNGTKWMRESASWDFVITRHDGKKEDCIEMSCQTSWDKNKIDDIRSICMKTVRKKDRHPNPSKLENMSVTVQAKDAPLLAPQFQNDAVKR